MDLSIIIPAYNESTKIEKDIFAADEFIKKNFESGEIIVVDDGSQDDTAEIVAECQNQGESVVHLLKLGENSGKGIAVRNGVSISKGEIVLYADAGLTVPFTDGLTGINLIKNNECDIANGSRKMTGSKIIKEQDLDRKIISKFFGKFVKLFLNIPKEMTDTQCGFKVYNGDVARDLYSKLETPGFLFEIEIIILAIQKGYTILEFPVTWKCDRDSRISIKKSSKNVAKEFINLFKKYRLN